MKEVSEKVKRRALFGVASVALFDSPVLGELLELPAPSEPTPLPSRIGKADVAAIRSLTEAMRGIARTYGGCADLVSPVAQKSLALAKIPGVTITPALAEMQTMAGWCCLDSGQYDNARAHFATAMDLGDQLEIVAAMRHAGIQMVDAGAYSDGLKAYQLGLIHMAGGDPEALAWLHAESAIPYAVMGRKKEAVTAIKMAHEQPMSDPFDAADMDYLTSRVYYRLGQIDTAERFAKSSVLAWTKGNSPRDSMGAEITLAVIHAKTGAPDTAILAQRAIAGVAPLRSIRARKQLVELVSELEFRSDSTCKDLAYHARGVAEMRMV